jgi:hypothetical protein
LFNKSFARKDFWSAVCEPQQRNKTEAMVFYCTHASHRCGSHPRFEGFFLVPAFSKVYLVNMRKTFSNSRFFRPCLA